MRDKLILQLFAKSNSSTQSGGTTTTQNEQYGGSSSHSEGGSTSHSEGGSHSETRSHSETQSHSQGGAHGESSGVVYASGEVEDRTRAQRDKLNTDYSQGAKVSDTYNRLQETLDGKPAFQSQYESKLNDLYNSIMNREKFNYNFNEDQMYQMYKDQYTQQGKQAMEDTIGRANAMNGGYGSSYSQSTGQQAYQNYLQQLNDVIPTLRNQAYQQYQDEGNELLNKYNITGDAYNREYGQYRDSVADWQADRSFNQSAYQDERNFDYNQFAQERNYWNQEYWNERNSAQSNQQVSDENNWNDSQSVTNAWSTTDENHWEDTQTAFWENVDSSNWSRGTSNVMQNNWSNTSQMSTGSSSGSSSGGSSGNNQKTTGFDNQPSGNSYAGKNLRDLGYSDSRSSGSEGATGYTNPLNLREKGFDDSRSSGGEDRPNVLNLDGYRSDQVNHLKSATKNEIEGVLEDLRSAQTGVEKAEVKRALADAGLSYVEIGILEDIINGKRNY